MTTATIMIDVFGIHKDSTNPPGTEWLTSGAPCLSFDDTTDELFTVALRLPDDYSSGLAYKWQYSMASATTNNVAVRSQVKAVTDGTEDIDSATAATIEASSDNAVPGTAGYTKTISHTMTNLDSAAAGDYIEIQLGRENGTSGTNATGDMYLHTLTLTYTTT